MDPIYSRLMEFIRTLTEKSGHGYRYEVMTGKKFYRIVRISPSSAPGFPPLRYVHCFVGIDTGYVFKSSSWHRAANGVRFSLMDDTSFRKLLDKAESTGGYLYRSL
jgi:hypothetical protein